jgi:hypothetical protein
MVTYTEQLKYSAKCRKIVSNALVSVFKDPKIPGTIAYSLRTRSVKEGALDTEEKFYTLPEEDSFWGRLTDRLLLCTHIETGSSPLRKTNWVLMRDALSLVLRDANLSSEDIKDYHDFWENRAADKSLSDIRYELSKMPEPTLEEDMLAGNIVVALQQEIRDFHLKFLKR